MPHAEDSSNHSVDLSDLPIDAAMAVAERDFMRVTVTALLRIARTLTRDGFDVDEINAALERERATLEAWRKESLEKLRGWLERGGEALN
jgi:hypothetical protein